MIESFKTSQRIIFKKGRQKKFIEDVLKFTKLGMNTLSKKTKINQRTLADWKREKFHISGAGMNSLLQLSGIKLTDTVQVKEQFWHVSKAGKLGHQKNIEKYGKMLVNEELRSSAWEKWWETKGKYDKTSILNSYKVNKPKKSSKLAEFFGIMIGDGSMSKYQFFITLHSEEIVFGAYVAKLMKDLFKISPKVIKVNHANAKTYTISRIQLVQYLNSLGLNIGDKVKQNLDIPDWIKNSKKYSIECIRGIFDTDGCLVRHKYISHGKLYKYKKIDITSRSVFLLKSIFLILANLGIKSRIGRDCVRVESIKDVRRFFKIVGSHNPKHLDKYNKSIF